MTIKVQNLSDLQDRRIMMEKKLPPYGYAFVILVGIFMLFLVVWSTHTNRIYVSQNAGTVQASNKTYIMSSYSGSITEMYISEGSYVNEGDLVAHIKSTDIDMQQDNLESQLKIYQTQLDQYNKLLQCVQDDTNYFSETNPEDQPYYYQYETYKSQVSQKTFDATAYQAAGYSDAQIKTMMEQSCGSGLSAAAVFQLFPFAGHSTRIPPSTGVYTGTRKLCLAQCSACRPMRSRLPP
jgi:multidrug resistance efflux pump